MKLKMLFVVPKMLPLLLTSNLKFPENLDKTAERSGQKTLVTHFC